jgi:hypothetical protein
MDLDGAWEIGLAEIQYPHSWYNVKNKEAWLKVVMIVGLGNRYPRQLLNKALHKVLFCDCTVKL